MTITWFGHDSFRLEADTVIVDIDPWQLPTGLSKSNLILITHAHYDHCSLEDVGLIAGPETAIIGPGLVADKLADWPVTVIASNESAQVKGVQIEALPAYNLNKFRSPGQRFHSEDEGGLAYVLNWQGKTICHAGDSDATPELEALTGLDVLFVPVSGTYVMTAEEAAGLVKKIQPRLVIPMHWGKIVGQKKDAEGLRKLYGEQVKTLRPGETITVPD